MKKYTKIICMIAAVCLLGAAAFCGFRIYSHYAHESEHHYGLDQYSFILTLALTTILSTGLGMLSWKYIEKPCLYHPKKKNQMNAMLG